MTRRLRALAVVAVLAALALSALPMPGHGVARAAEYRMTTVAEYVLQPDEERVAVSVEVTFENTTPDPAGQFSIFEVVDLALQPGVTAVTAEDAQGELTVSVGEREGFTLASVRPRAGVRYEDETTFTLTYRIPDASAPGVRVRPSLVTFPVWSFGTQGRVRVAVPGTYEVSVDGDELDARRTADGWLLESGPVEDPSRWLAQLLAVGPASYATLTRAVPLDGATVDLQVRAWADDEAWGERTIELLAAGLPLLEQRIGLPYPDVGPLVVTEALSGPEGGMGEPAVDGTQLLAGFDQPSFTVLHQAAHVWFSERLAGARWMREGFASWAAGAVAAEVDVDAPYDPVARREELAGDAFPLVSWGEGEASEAQDAFAYAASWAVVEELVAAVGEDRMRRAWQRIVADVNPYQPVAEQPPDVEVPALPGQPVDSRTLLDQLEAVSDAGVAEIFGEWVFDEETAGLLDERTAAREAYAQLLDAAGTWGPPQPVQVDLAAWRFDSARERIDETLDWLADRDQLLAAAEAAGLTVPQRLRDRYRTAGGGPDARAELDAELAVVSAYAETSDRAGAERGFLAQIGLIGGERPSELLAEARALFAEGELRGAAEAVDRASSRLEQATMDGIVRMVAAAVIIVAALALAYRLARPRRERSTTDYTAAR